MKGALLSATAELEVPFQDLDPMEVAWHGNYFRYFEAARVRLLRMIDYDYPQMQASCFMWPIVEARVKFTRPLTYGQHIVVTAGLTEWENRMKIVYRIDDAVSRQKLTTAYTIQCAVSVDTGELQLVSPPALLERLQEYLQ
jgi:acyl-CoA thioester hydrolase